MQFLTGRKDSLTGLPYYNLLRSVSHLLGPIVGFSGQLTRLSSVDSRPYRVSSIDPARIDTRRFTTHRDSDALPTSRMANSPDVDAQSFRGCILSVAIMPVEGRRGSYPTSTPRACLRKPFYTRDTAAISLHVDSVQEREPSLSTFAVQQRWPRHLVSVVIVRS
jgi:hypothetical protein